MDICLSFRCHLSLSRIPSHETRKHSTLFLTSTCRNGHGSRALSSVFLTNTQTNTETPLNLLATNDASNQDYDDLSSKSIEENTRKMVNMMAILRGKLDRLNLMVDQLQVDYDTIRMNVEKLKQNKKAEKVEEQKVYDVKFEKKRRNFSGGALVPRDLSEIGLNINANIEMDLEPSSSRTRSSDRLGSPPENNIEVASKELDLTKNIIDEEKEYGEETKREESIVDPIEVDAFLMRARAKSDGNMISDGCRWKMYGQKLLKGNPNPRSYYRCSLARGCPARKRVQKCAEDKTVVITTYKGYHNHTLPPEAMEMAQITDAAARMLLSGSTSSSEGTANASFFQRSVIPGSTNPPIITASAPSGKITLDFTQTPNPPQH